MLLHLREPVSAGSHAAGMLMGLALTWLFWRRCQSRQSLSTWAAGFKLDECLGNVDFVARYERGKTWALLVFGLSLAACYGGSALYHSAEPGMWLDLFRRIDHIGIYLLIAGTYTPAAWALMAGPWRRATLSTIWVVAIFCAGRVGIGGVLSPWATTLIYLGMGWGVLICYREFARELGHRRLLLLPAGGAFYTVGALINIMNWPVLLPGSFGPHDLFHFFVLAGTACHAGFMLHEVVPAAPPLGWSDSNPSLADMCRLVPLYAVAKVQVWSCWLNESVDRRGFRIRLHRASPLWRRPFLWARTDKSAEVIVKAFLPCSGSSPAGESLSGMCESTTEDELPTVPSAFDVGLGQVSVPEPL